ncbi:type II toxin-antitoxin system toxin DNA ADP-ribosyl transferase DarT [Micromonospora sp. KLBMP9576]|uniref:type II toxin-antitoxin system toxin DNA ADP-ribosyl transferase DarT n=1 Tax=Micromonospora sp. KLBMP9576 TaxID=3424769 RepID=UPI003D912689
MHFTHIDNLPAILTAGRLTADNLVRGRLVTDVGSAAIKASRRTRRVTCPPGGVVADYVPFYFAPRSPMMYRIAKEHENGRAGCYPGGDDPLVYLVSSIDRVHDAGLLWVASDGNCAASLTCFSRDLGDLAHLVDWPLMRERVWKDVPEDQDRMRRRMAELLVHQEFPLGLVAYYAVRTPARETQLRHVLRSAGIIDAYVVVRDNWYYGFTRREVRE